MFLSAQAFADVRGKGIICIVPDKKDITICKALKHPALHSNGVVQTIRNKDTTLSFVFKKRIKDSKRNPLGLLMTKGLSDSAIVSNHIN